MIKCSWLLAHPFLCRPMLRSRHSSLYKPPIFSPGSGPAQTPEIPLSRRVGPSPAERERETPGPVAVTSVSPGPEIQIHQLQTESGGVRLRFIVVFWKSVPVSASQLARVERGRDTIIAGISCAGHNSNTCGEHFQVTNILQ